MSDDRRPTGATGRSSAAGDQRPHVLVVDDDADIADSIGDVLRRGGYGVTQVEDGQGAIEAAQRHRIGLVLLDWRLPERGPSGGALVRRLRDVCGFAVPVVVLSADPQSWSEAREAQVSDYLPKPF